MLTKPKGNRCVIYVRVSTELQAGQASPVEQEEDCRKLAADFGLEVVYVYRDIERYRVGGKMVEPSGTRSDRPQFRKMMADADKGLYDVVIAWRQDRLYRGINAAALDIADRVKNEVFTVALVKDHYDPKTAMLMAWAAGIENEARRDRMAMGRRALIEQGKTWGQPPYGYDTDPETKRVIFDPNEDWVVLGIFERFAQGETVHAIRDWLIASGAQQRRNRVSTAKWSEYEWAPWTIREILRRDEYATGIRKIKADGQIFEQEIPPIVPLHHLKAVRRRQENYQHTKVGNVNWGEYLLIGKVYCGGHNQKMRMHRASHQKGGYRGEYRYYQCARYVDQIPSTLGCAGNVRIETVEEKAWAIIYREISTDGKLDGMVKARIHELKAKQADIDLIIAELNARLAQLTTEKNNLIRWARQGMITEVELEQQMIEVRAAVTAVEKEISLARMNVDHSVEGLQRGLDMLHQDIDTALVALAHLPRNDDEARYQWQVKKHIVDNFVERIIVTRPGWTRGARMPKVSEGGRSGQNGPQPWPIKVVVEMAIDLDRFVISEEVLS